MALFSSANDPDTLIQINIAPQRWSSIQLRTFPGRFVAAEATVSKVQKYGDANDKDPKAIFDPKLNFELPREIGLLLEQTVSISAAFSSRMNSAM